MDDLDIKNGVRFLAESEYLYRKRIEELDGKLAVACEALEKADEDIQSALLSDELLSWDEVKGIGDQLRLDLAQINGREG